MIGDRFELRKAMIYHAKLQISITANNNMPFANIPNVLSNNIYAWIQCQRQLHHISNSESSVSSMENDIITKPTKVV